MGGGGLYGRPGNRGEYGSILVMVQTLPDWEELLWKVPELESGSSFWGQRVPYPVTKGPWSWI